MKRQYSTGSQVNRNPVCVRRLRSGLVCAQGQWKTVAPIGIYGNKSYCFPYYIGVCDVPAKLAHVPFETLPTVTSDLEEKLAQYHTKFWIDANQYVLKSSFKKCNEKNVGCLELFRLANTSISSEGIKVTDEKKQQPCSVWVQLFMNLNNKDDGDQEMLDLKTSEKTNHWISDLFVFEFDLPGLTEEDDADELPLNFALWIEFESCSGGQKNALKQITDLFVGQSKCDIQFCFEGDRRIGGHSFILGARSPVFEAMFQHDMKETKTGQVDIQDVKFDIFKQFLYYIYSGRIEKPLTEDTAQLLYLSADKYCIPDLKDECVEFLLACVRIDNAINLLAWSYLHSVEKLVEAALSFTVCHCKAICLQDDWTQLVKNYPDLCVLATRRIVERL